MGRADGTGKGQRVGEGCGGKAGKEEEKGRKRELEGARGEKGWFFRDTDGRRKISLPVGKNSSRLRRY